ncbi:hypothetical protein SAMN04488082_12367 [Desulfomicrobium apsheronum]|uniref:Uncharacterized protein n=1 Tax=Desulfomicrobium apsheronum TaxID=52560 RepID=A0A1I3ZE60_9BACT|nr:VRR-NUC domain-containing protein [Desulfomicrobium apsheronum]SFK42327.1 hypothetical protein SAMN04488082_12367 [Desulfomicrobium apsheronum]
MSSKCVGTMAPIVTTASQALSRGVSPERALSMICEECRELASDQTSKGVDDFLLCRVMCCCSENPSVSTQGRSMRQQCVHEVLTRADLFQLLGSRYKSEISYDMTATDEAGQRRPRPFMHRDNAGMDTTGPSTYWQGRARSEIEGYQGGRGMVRRPDVVIVRNPSMPPTQDNIERIVEMKFVGDVPDHDQTKAYSKIVGNEDKVDLMREGVECICHDDLVPEPQPVVAPMPAPEDEAGVNWGAVGKTAMWGALAAVAAVGTVAAMACPFDGPFGEAAGAAATTGAASRTAAAFANIFRAAPAL